MAATTATTPQTPISKMARQASMMAPSSAQSNDSDPMPSPPKVTSDWETRQDQDQDDDLQFNSIHSNLMSKYNQNNQESMVGEMYDQRRRTSNGTTISNGSRNSNGNPVQRDSPIWNENEREREMNKGSSSSSPKDRERDQSPSSRSLAASMGAPPRSTTNLSSQLGMGRPSNSHSNLNGINNKRPLISTAGRSSSYAGSGPTTSNSRPTTTNNNNPISTSTSTNSIPPSNSGTLKRSAKYENHNPIQTNGNGPPHRRTVSSANPNSKIKVEEEMINHQRPILSTRISDPSNRDQKSTATKSRSSPSNHPIPSSTVGTKRPYPSSNMDEQQPLQVESNIDDRRTVSSSSNLYNHHGGRVSGGSNASGSGSGSGERERERSDSSQERIQHQHRNSNSGSYSPSNTVANQHQEIEEDDEPSSQPLPTPPVASETSAAPPSMRTRARTSVTSNVNGVGNVAYTTPAAQSRLLGHNRGLNSSVGGSGMRLDRSVQRTRVATAGRSSLRPAPSARRVLRTQDEEEDDDDETAPSGPAAEETNGPTKIKVEDPEEQGLENPMVKEEEEEEEDRKPFSNSRNAVKRSREDENEEEFQNAVGSRRVETDAEMEDLDGSPGIGRNSNLPSSYQGGYHSSRNQNLGGSGGSDKSNPRSTHNLPQQEIRTRTNSPHLMLSKKTSDDDLPRRADDREKENLPEGYEYGAGEDEEAEMEEEKEHERSLLLQISPQVQRSLPSISPAQQPQPLRSEAHPSRAASRPVLKEGQNRITNSKSAMDVIRNAKVAANSIPASRGVAPVNRLQAQSQVRENEEIAPIRTRNQLSYQDEEIPQSDMNGNQLQFEPSPEDEEALRIQSHFLEMMVKEGKRQRNTPDFDPKAWVGSKDISECRDTILNHNKFKKIRRIGEGGFSTVWSVKGPQYHFQPEWNPELNGYVASKVPLPEEDQAFFAMKQVNLKKLEPQSKAELIQEAELLDQLSKKEGNERYILRYFGCRIGKDSMKILLEVGDVDFSTILKRNYLSRDEIRKYFIQMLEAVKFVHEEGQLVHTDLKPGNFLLVKNRIKLIDFGIAQKIPAHTIHISRDAIVGTPNYMAPEAIKIARKDGRKVFKAGKASDVWSLGCILYQMVYGKPPFDKYTGNQRMDTIIDPKHEIFMPNYRNLEDETSDYVDDSLIETIRWALKYDTNQRATIDQLLNSDFLSEGLDDKVTITRRTVRDIYRKVMMMDKPEDISMDELGDRLFENLLANSSS